MDGAQDAGAQRVRLRAAGVCLRGEQVFADNRLTQLLVDDLCWQIALTDWSAREPRRWQRRRRAKWRAEEAALWAERGRIRALAEHHGLPVI